jgi:GT2 family glycosyltransferase
LKLVGPDFRTQFEMAFMPKRTDIIIPTYKKEDVTVACVKSLTKNTKSFRLLWIDNGSGDESKAKVIDAAKGLPDAECISIDRNLGFAKAVNHGLRRSICDRKTDYVVLLNNDVIVSPGWLDNLIACQVANNLDAVGPLTSQNNPHSLDALRGVEPTLPNLSPNMPVESCASILQGQYGTKALLVNNMLSFFCCLMPMRTVELVGLLDEQFFAYGEDNDYCERMRRLGMRMGISLGSYVHHAHGVTSSTMGKDWAEQKKKEALKLLAAKYHS